MTIEEPFWMKYKIGGKDKNGYEIKTIVGRTKKSIVYLCDTESKLKCSWDFDLEGVEEILAKVQAIKTQIKTVLPKKQHYVALNLLATSLFSALEDNNKNDLDSYFQEIRDYLSTKTHENLHFVYLITAILCSGLSFLPTAFCYYFTIKSTVWYQLSLGAGFGGLGALISIFQRFNQIPLEKYSSRNYIILKSFSRVSIGLIFGTIFILLIKAKIIFEFINGNVYLVCIFSIISGLNERFVPDILDNIEKSSSKKIKPNFYNSTNEK